MTINKKTLRDIDVNDKTVVLRLDLNVPIVDNIITDETRIDASLPTIKYLLEKNARIIILSHLGRINKKEDIENSNRSLKLVYEALKKKLPNVEILFSTSNNKQVIKSEIKTLKNQEILLLENTRFFNYNNETKTFDNAESAGNEELAKFFASLGDVYINDAFATLHRDHASNALIAKYQPNNAIGFLIEKELNTLSSILDNPSHPFVAIFGGGKVKDKIPLIYEVLKKADKVFISGGMVYTFAKAMGYDVGKTKVEDDLLDVARDIIDQDKKHKIVLAEDYMAVDEFVDKPGTPVVIGSKEAEKLMGLDIGPKTEEKYEKELEDAKTIFYNGPLGVFEMKNFQHGTKALFSTLAKLTKNGAKTIIGGGDSASAAIQFGYKDDFTFISTGGGASLAYLQGKDLPGLKYMDEKGLTPHIGAAKNKISKFVVFCGDPLRAKWIAETFLHDAFMVTNIRNMSGYSGYYKDLFITVMGHGMGIPSIGIYSYELYKFYDVELIIRLGTAGALMKDLNVRSLILAERAYSDSEYAKELGLHIGKTIDLPSDLAALAKNVAKAENIELIPGNVLTSDCFYTALTPQEQAKKGNSIAVEMEVFGLYANALKLKKKAIGLVTISDNLITHQELDAINRQNSLVEMCKLGLEIIYKYSKK